MNYSRDFWRTNSKYHPLAKQYEENIAVWSPSEITCNTCPVHGCAWHAGGVTYYKYTGEAV